MTEQHEQHEHADTPSHEPPADELQEHDQEPGATTPEPFLQGTFALFATPKGDIVLSTSSDVGGQQTVRVPRFVVAQARRANPQIREILEAAQKAST